MERESGLIIKTYVINSSQRILLEYRYCVELEIRVDRVMITLVHLI